MTLCTIWTHCALCHETSFLQIKLTLRYSWQSLRWSNLETKQHNMILTADLGEGGEFFFFLSKRVSPVSLGKHMDKGLAQARNLPGHILQSNLCAGGLRHLFWKATIQQIQFKKKNNPKTKAIWTRVWGIKIYTKTIAVLTNVTSLNKRKFKSSFHIRRGKPNNGPTVDLF